jgi:hypothetical protein
MAEIPQAVSDNAVETVSQSIIPTNPYSRIRREISEEDLQSPAVQRILLGEVDKLQSRVVVLEVIESKFHEKDKIAAVMEEKLKGVQGQEILYGICLTMGSVVIGLSGMIWSNGYGWIAIAVGVVLLAGGIGSKVVTWR